MINNKKMAMDFINGTRDTQQKNKREKFLTERDFVEDNK